VTLPGTENGEFITTSYEHDEYGATNEDPVIKKQQQDKRFKKLETFIQQEFTKDFYGYEIINPEAKEFFVTFGVNRYVIEEYIREKNKKSVKYGLIIIKVLQPLDMRLKEFLDTNTKRIKKLIFVEMNTSGQLQELITNKCLLNDKKRNNKIKHIRKYILYPIFSEDIVM
jgi:2-oxoglutarate ferredoxin oxidoreductase subunit alpha